MSTGVDTTQCSFCVKGAHEVERIVAGPGVFICNECVALCDQIMTGTAAEVTQLRELAAHV